MDKIYHVFVSSTYQDLKEERKAVSESIARAGYVAEGMEIFPASSQQQMDFIKSVIDRCDYYILILAGKYGSLYQGDSSYTKAEFEYALSKSIPVLAFVHSDVDSLPPAKKESDASKVALLSKFHAEILSNSMVDHWDDKGILAAKALAALAQEANRNPRSGWIRGGGTPPSELIDNISQLKLENQRLVLALKESSDVAGNNQSDPSEQNELSENSKFQIRYDISGNYISDLNRLIEGADLRQSIKITPKELLLATASMYQGYSSTQLARHYVSDYIGKLAPNKTGGYMPVKIENADFDVLIMAMVDLNLWQVQNQQYKLGDKGRRIFLEEKMH